MIVTSVQMSSSTAAKFHSYRIVDWLSIVEISGEQIGPFRRAKQIERKSGCEELEESVSIINRCVVCRVAHVSLRGRDCRG